MHNKLLNKLGAACLHMALSATSISALGAANSYYRTRRGAYGRNTQYLADTGLTPFSTTTFKDKSVTDLPSGLIGEESQDFHFEIGRKVRELLIVDGAVQNKSMFLRQAAPGLEVVELGEGGIVSLMETLSRYQGLDAVHIVSHAQSGAMQLGGELLDADAFENNLSAFAALNGAIKAGGDLLLYGCELAKGTKGEDFLELVQANTHADLAASVDKTGNAAFGGDWDLEIQKGNIEAKPLPESIALKDFTGVLQNFSFTSSDITAGGAYGGASNDVQANEDGAGTTYTMTIDGNSDGIYAHSSGYLYFGGGGGPMYEDQITISFTGGETFDPSGIYIYVSSAVTVTVASDVSGSENYVFSANTGYTFDLSSLASNTTSLTISISPDASGRIDNVVMTSISAADVTDPTFTSAGSTPNDDATDVATTADIVVDFDEDIAAGTGNITVRDVTGASDFEVFNVALATATSTPAAGALGILNDKLYINPTSALSEQNDYSIRIAATAIDDLAGNSFAGITDDVTFNFTTADETNPTFNSAGSTPNDDATGVATAADIVVDFDENIAAGTGNITVRDVTGASDFEVFNVALATATSTPTDGALGILNDKLYINPTSALTEQNDYSIRIDATAIDDASGNSFAGITDDVTFNFTSADETNPTFNSAGSTPIDDATDVATAADIVVDFDENIAAGTGNITVRDVTGASDFEVFNVALATATSTPTDGALGILNDKLYINPTSALTEQNDYSIRIDATAIDDASGNSFAGITDDVTFNFTTADETNPTFNSAGSTPNDDATDVATANDIVVDFDENIAAGTGNITVRDVTGASDFEVFNVALATATSTPTDGALGILNDKLYINPTSALTEQNDYSIRIDATAIDDASGNSFAGITDDVTFNFTSADETNPTFNSAGSTPNDDATGVALGADIVVDFDENIAAGTGNITVRDVTGASDFEVFNVALATATSTPTDGALGILNDKLYINPTSALTGTNDYSIRIDATAIDDASGNSFAGITDDVTFNFTTVTPDVTDPTFDGSNSTPNDDATDVATAADIVVDFDEDIAAGTGNITVRDVTGASDFEVFNVALATATSTPADGALGILNDKLYINPTSALTEQNDYSIRIAATAIDDLAGNSFAGITDDVTFNFTSADETNPTFNSAGSTPNDDATDVATAADIVMDFDENIAAGTGNITVRDVTGASDFEVFNVALATATSTPTDGALGILNDKLYINPTSALTEQNDYSIRIDATAIDDASGNSFAGITDDVTFNFTSADETNPTFNSAGSTPNDDATDVATAADIVVDFDENIAAGTGNITVRDVTGASDFEVFNVALATATSTPTDGALGILNDKLYINPTSALTEQNDYSIRIDATAIDDASGNSFAGITDDVTFNFTTADETNPTFNSAGSTPNDDATDVATANDIVVDFDENIAAGTGNITVRDVTGASDFEVFNIALATATSTPTDGALGILNDKLYINPTSALTEQNDYSIRIDATAIDDASGNSFAGITDDVTFNFTTADETNPTFNSAGSTPNDDATDVATAADIVVDFDENIVAGTGNITVRDVTGASDFEVFNVALATATSTPTDGALGILNDKLYINPTSALAEQNDYSIRIDATAIDDASGNSFAGITDDVTFNFTSADETDPTFNSAGSTPNDDATDVATAADIVVDFDENIAAGTGNITVRDVTGASDFEVFNVALATATSTPADGALGILNDKLYINPTSALTEQNDYSIRIDATAIDDASGNSFAGITDDVTFNFTSADETNPTFNSAGSTPNDDATDVATAADIVVDFDENIVAGTGNITVRDVTGASDFEVFNVALATATSTPTDGALGILNDKLYINPTSALTEQNDYSIRIDATAIDDASGNSFAGITDDVTFNFTSADETAPTVTITRQSPTVANTISSSVTFRVTFNEDVQDVTVADFDVDNGSISGESLNALTPQSASVYDVTVDSYTGTGVVDLDFFSSQDISDLAGNPFDEGSGITAEETFTIVAPDSDSDIIESPAFTANTDIDPSANTNGGSPIAATGDGVRIATFRIRDGGSTAPDTDDGSTELTDLTIALANHDNLQRVALFDGSTLIDEAAAGATVTFNSISLTANDDMTKDFDVYVTFLDNGTVDDKDVLNVTITDADVTASGSGSDFGTFSAASMTGLGADENEIEVAHTNLIFTDEPTVINVGSNFTLEVSAVDGDDNVDTDFSETITVEIDFEDASPNPALSGTTMVVPTNGVSLFNTLQVNRGANIIFRGVSSTYTDGSGNEALTATISANDFSSDIIEGTITYEQFINYVQYNDTDIDGSGTDEIVLARFDIRDGGAAGDTDKHPTELTDISFNVTGVDNIARLAIYDETNSNVEVAEQAVNETANSATVTFSSISINVTDVDDTPTPGVGTITIALRATFKENTDVDDQDQVSFTITSVTATSGNSNSGFAAADGGGAATTLGSDDNKVDVIGDRIVVTNDGSVSGGSPYERNSGTITIDLEAQDTHGNVDLDETSSIDITGPTDFDGSSTTTFSQSLTSGTTSAMFTVFSEESGVVFTAADGNGNTGSRTGTTSLTTVSGSSTSGVDVFDTTPVTITSPAGGDLDPADNDGSATLTDQLTIQFSEDVVANSGTINVVSDEIPPTVYALDVTDAGDVDVSSGGGLVYLNLPAVLASTVSYYVAIPDGAFLDANDNAGINGSNGGIAGFSSTTTWDFTMEQVLSLLDVNVPSTTQLTLVFNEDAVINGQGATDFTIQDALGTFFNPVANTDINDALLDDELELTVPNLTSAVGDLSLSYTEAAGQIEADADGSRDLGSITSFQVDLDQTAPSPLSAAFGPTTDSEIDVTFDDVVQVLTGNNSGDFTVTDGFGNTYTVDASGGIDDNVAGDAVVRLTMSGGGLDGAVGDVTVDYNGANGEIFDYGENDATTGSVVIDADSDPVGFSQFIVHASSTTPTSANSVSYDIHFDEVIEDAEFTLEDIVVNIPDGVSINGTTTNGLTANAGAFGSSFTLTNDGTANLEYLLTISNISGNGSLSVTLTSAGINDFGSNNLDGGDQTSPTITIDNTAPTLVITKNAPASGTTAETNSNTVSFDLAFSEVVDVANFDESDISLDLTGATADALMAGDLVDDGDNQNFTLTVSNVAANGTLGITVSGTGVQDPGGNIMGANETSATFIIDNTQPTVVVTDDHQDPDDTTDDTVRDADNVTITATFTEVNTLDGTPTIAIGTSVSTTNMTATGDPLVWTYTWNVPTGDDPAEGVIISVSDVASNALGTQTNTNAGDYEIDNTAPTATPVSITSTNASVTFAAINDDVDLDFTVSETLEANPVVTFQSGGGNINDAVGISNTALDYTASYTVNSLDNVGAVTFTLDFTDVAGNVAGQVTTVTDASSVTVDSEEPAIEEIRLNALSNGTSASTNDGSVSFEVEFSEPVGQFSYADDIQPSVVTTGTLDISMMTPTEGTSDNITWTITFPQVEGDGTLSFDVLNGNGGGSPVSDQIIDGSGNTLQGMTDVEASSPSVTFDNTDPGVTLTRNSPSAGTVTGTNANNVSFDVAFSEVIDNAGFTLADIQINIPDGVSINAVTTDMLTADNAGFGGSISLTPDGNNQDYTVTITNIAGDGALGITLLSAGITDPATNQLAGGTNQTSADFTIDNTAPTATAVTMASNNGTSADRAIATNVVTISLTVDDDLTGTPNVNFIRSGGALINDTPVVGGSNPNYTITYTVNALDSDGTVTFDIDFTDESGNAVASSVTALTAGSAVVVDNIDPTVTITRNAPGAGTADQTNSNTVSFDLAFSEVVNVATFDFTDITLNLSGATADALVALDLVDDGDNQNFTLTVSNVASDGTVGITLSGTGITDPSGNQLNGGTNEVSPLFTIDNTDPTVTLTRNAVSSGLFTGTNDNAISFDVAFSEPINNGTFTLADIQINSPGLASINGVTTDGLTADNAGFGGQISITPDGDDQNYTINIAMVAGNGDLGITLISAGIADPATNQLAGGTNQTSADFTIDNTAPTATAVTMASNNGTSADRAIATNVVTISLTVDDDLTGTPNVNFIRSGGALINDTPVVGGSNPNYTVTYTVNALDSDGTVTFDIDFTDDAGNAVASSVTALTAGSAVVVDNIDPTVTITRNAPGAGTADQTNSNTVSFDLAFSEVVDVATFDFTDITLNLSGATADALVALDLVDDGDNQNFTLTVSNVASDGTVGITLSGTGITDPSGNQLNGGTNEVSSLFTIDNTDPTVTLTRNAVSSGLFTGTNDNAISFDVAFSEAINNGTFTLADIQINSPGLASINGVTTDGLTADNAGFGGQISITPDGDDQNYTINIAMVAGDGDLGITLISAGIADPATNQLAGGVNQTSADFTIDNTAPTATAVTMASNNGTSADRAIATNVVTISLTVDDDLTGTPNVNFIRSGGALINDTPVVGGSNPNYTVTYTVNALDSDGTVTFDIDFTDDAGNAVASSVTALTAGSAVVVDNIDPTVTITRNAPGAGTADQTNSNTVSFDLAFSEVVNVATFDFTDITLNLSGATADALVALDLVDDGDNQNFTLTVSNVAADGTVGITLSGTGITDPSGNQLNGGTNEVSSLFTIDNTDPTVTLTRNAVSSGLFTGTNDNAISFDVAFSEAINNGTFTLADIQINSPGLASINGVTTDGLTADNAGFGGQISITPDGDDQNYTINIAMVAGDGDLGITLISAGIADPATNQLAGGVNQTSADFTIDNTAPTATAVTMASNNSTSADRAIATNVVTISLTVDDDLTGTPNVNFIRSGGALINDTPVVGGSNPNYTVTYTVNALDSDGTVTFDIDFTDDAGNAVASSVTALTAGSAVVVDNIDPTVTITRNAPGAGTADQTNSNTVSFDLAFSEVVDVATFDFTDITLNLSGATADALVALDLVDDGDNQNFTLTVSNVASDGTVGITLSGTGITDASGNQLNGGTNEVSPLFTIDNTDPTVTLTRNAVSSGLFTGTNDNAISFDVAFSEPINNGTFTLADIQINSPGLASINSVTTDGLTADNAGFGGQISITPDGDDQNYTINIAMVASDGDLGITLISAGIADPATNQLAGGTNQTSADFTIDNTAPTATAVTMASNNSTSADRAIATNVVTISLTVDDDLTGTPNVNFIRSGGALINDTPVVGGSNPNYTVTYTVNALDSDGTVTFDIDFTDDAGNAVASSVTALTAGSAVVVDNIDPTVTITRNAPGAGTADQTNSNTVSFDLAFSEVVDVATFDESDITLNLSGATADALMAGDLVDDGDNQNFTLTVSNVAADGTVGITLSGTGITDASGNQLNGGTNEVSPLFTIDNTDPTVTLTRNAVSSGSFTGTNDNAVSFDVAFSEPINNSSFTLADIQVNIPDGASINSVTTDMLTADNAGFGGQISITPDGDDQNYTINIAMVDDDGDLGITLISAGIADPATNQLAGGTNQTSADFTIDNTAPTATAVTMASNNGTSADRAIATNVVTISLTVDDDLTGTPNVNFIRSGGALINDTPVVGGSNPNYTVTYTVNALDSDGTVTFDIDFTDDAGNAVASSVTALTAGSAVVVDNIDPTVAITRDAVTNGSFSGTNDNALSFSLVFDEPVNDAGFGLDDITINIPDGASINGVTTNSLTADNAGFGGAITIDRSAGDDQNYVIDITSVAGDGDLGITLTGTGIVDQSGNQLNGGSNETSSDFTIDNTAPTTTISAVINGSSTTQIIVSFSEPVTTNETNPTDFTVTDEDQNNLAVSAQADNGAGDTDILLTVADFTNAEGDLLVTYANTNTEVADLAGNAAPTSTTTTINRTFAGRVGLSENATGTAGDTDGDVALYRTTVSSGFNIFSDTPVDITPSITNPPGTGSTITIYRDAALTDPVTGATFTNVTTTFSPTVDVFLADEGLTLGGTNAGDYDASANDINGVYTFYITETAVNGTTSEGPSVQYSIAFLDSIENSNQQTVFPIGNTTGTTLSVANPSGQDLGVTAGTGSGAFSAPQVNSGTSFVTGASTDLASTSFTPNLVVQGSYQVDFSWTNSTSGVTATFESVTEMSITSIVTIFDVSQDVNFCRDEGDQAFVINTNPSGVDTGSDTDVGNPNFYDIEIYYIKDGDALTTIGSAGIYRSAGGNIASSSGVLTYGTANGRPAQDVTTPTFATNTDWTFDPSAAEALIPAASQTEIDTLLVAYILADDAATTNADLSVNNTIEIYLFPDPQITMSSSLEGLEDQYCVNDDPITLVDSIYVYDGFSGNTSGPEAIDNGYVLEYYGSDGTYTTLQSSFDFTEATGTEFNTFDPGNPDQQGNSITSPAGYYRIVYTGRALTDGSCEPAAVNYDFEVIENASSPTIVAGDLTNRGGLNSDVYLLEYVDGDLDNASDAINSLDAISGNSISSTIEWYTTQTGGSTIATGTTLNLKDDLYNGNNPGAGSQTIYIEDRNVLNNAGTDISASFDGCISSRREVQIEIYNVPEDPQVTIDDNSVNEENLSTSAGSSYLFEYCDGDVVSDVTLTNDISDNRAHFVLIDEDKSDTTWFNSGTIDWSNDIFSGGTAGDTTIFVLYVTEDSTFALGDGNADAFRGAVSDTTQIELAVFTEAVKDVIDQENDLTNNIFFTEYFTCQSEAIGAITTNNVSSDGDYHWYADDGDLTFEDDGSDAEIVQSTSLRNVDILNVTTAYQSASGATTTTQAYTTDDDTDGTAGIYYYWVTQKRGASTTTDFPGCESDATLIALTVYPSSDEPQISLDGGTNVFSVTAGNTDSVDFELFYDATELTAAVEFTAVLNGFTDAAFTTDATSSPDTSSVSQVTHEFNWYNSNAQGDRLAQVTSGETVTAQALGLVGFTSDDSLHIYLEQVTNIAQDASGDEFFSGCVSNGVVILFNIKARPSAPTGTTNFYYCEGETVEDLTMTGEGNAIFTYLDVNNNVIHQELADGSTGESVAEIETEIDELGLGSTSGDSVYTVKVVQTTDTTSVTTQGVSDFGRLPYEGAHSDTTIVTINVRALPDSVNITDPGPFCDEGDNTQLQITFAGTGDFYTVYADDMTTELSILGGSASQLPFSLDSAANGRDSTVFITQTIDSTIDPSFDGCESPLRQVDVFPVPLFESYSNGTSNINILEACGNGITAEISVTNLDTLTEDNFTVTWVIDGTTRTESDNFSIEIDENFSGVTSFEITVLNDVTGCSDVISESITIGATPEPDFRIGNITANSSTTFQVLDFGGLSDATIDNITFSVQDASGAEVFTSVLPGGDGSGLLNSTFTRNLSAGAYTAIMTTTSTSGCIKAVDRPFNILPLVVLSADTIITFDDGNLASWFAEEDRDNSGTVQDGQRVLVGSSWENTTPNGDEIATDADGGSSIIWVTDADSTYRASEVSYVYSPAFDIRNLTRPAVAFDYYLDLINVGDGVVFQFSGDDGATWNTLGSLTTGRQWYNTEAITASPGGLNSNPNQYGWAGEDAGEIWRNGVHALTGGIISNPENVRFRFAIGSRAGAKDEAGEDAEGFAFDNFTLFSREKVTLVETFSSTLSVTSNRGNEDLNSVLTDGGQNSLSNEAIWVNYFTDLENTNQAEDQLHASRPTGVNSRVSSYSIEEVPRAVLAGTKLFGDREDETIDGLYGLTRDEIANSTLDASQFTITLQDAVIEDGLLSLNARYVAQPAVSRLPSNAELSIRFFVLQSEVDATMIDSGPVEGTEDEPVTYKNVLRAILPSTEGRTLGAIPANGDIIDVSTDTDPWEINGIIGNSGETVELRIVTFIQDDLNKEIYQVATNTIDYTIPETVTGVKTAYFDPGEQYEIYPNPSDKQFAIRLENPVKDELEWSLYDQSGRIVKLGAFRRGEDEILVDTRELSGGLYLLKLFNEEYSWNSQRVIIIKGGR